MCPLRHWPFFERSSDILRRPPLRSQQTPATPVVEALASVRLLYPDLTSPYYNRHGGLGLSPNFFALLESIHRVNPRKHIITPLPKACPYPTHL